MQTENASDDKRTESEVTESGTRPDTSPTALGQEMMGAGMKPMEMCPMAAMCQGIMAGKRGGLSWLLSLPGVLLVVGGLVVILVPQVLVWLLGMTSIVLGGLFWVIASRIRKVATEWGDHEG